MATLTVKNEVDILPLVYPVPPWLVPPVLPPVPLWLPLPLPEEPDPPPAMLPGPEPLPEEFGMHKQFCKWNPDGQEHIFAAGSVHVPLKQQLQVCCTGGTTGTGWTI